MNSRVRSWPWHPTQTRRDKRLREIDAAFVAIAKSGSHAVLVQDGPLFARQVDRVAALALKYRLPSNIAYPPSHRCLVLTKPADSSGMALMCSICSDVALPR